MTKFGIFLGVILLVGTVTAVKRQCCVSKRFFSKLHITTGTVKNGVAEATALSGSIDYDYDLQMERVTGFIYNDTDHTTTNFSIWNDYSHSKKYALYWRGSVMSQNCVITYLDPDSQTPPCLPEFFKFEANYTYGSGKESLRIQSWSGMYDNLHESWQVSVNDCTPVTMTRFGLLPDGTRLVMSTAYVDVTQYRISEDTAFDLPQACRMNDMPVGR